MHECLDLERGEAKMWRHQLGDPFTSVEQAALAHYQRKGWSGCAAEGGLMLTLIKAASFPKLSPEHADTFVESLYYHDVPGRLDHATLISNAAAADIERIARNWKVISASSGHSPAFYPRVGWEHVEGLFNALGAARLTEIVRIFATAPYDLRAGWPDLTLWRGSEIRFVEVKSPNDGVRAKPGAADLGAARSLGLRHRAGGGEMNHHDLALLLPYPLARDDGISARSERKGS